ncbi:bifunctional adenosylcobinamide kinase/adenosylcobinamide-phosphate guanylyltransferase [Marivita sp. S0852]|uniref:bifunctional adenosylcobinamide kinase/adenosylcobinamide-phosphate guanylyltransferase n=1 Tax=Marivita sp. S0852 TaxID=3373893 RepID=UPI00398214AB
MSRIVLVTGGARSGKSRIAETRCLLNADTAIYIATGQAGDDEMQARIQEHQARRGPEWRTIAEPIRLVAALTDSNGTGPRLVDCLTLWLSNLMLSDRDWQAAVSELVTCLAQQTSPVVLVTNEVGMGIVPENALARAFRDAAGKMNQQVASVADEVIFAVSGLPLRVK